MNYDKIINATYEWMTLEKIIWFLLFFWLSIPVLFFIPIASEAGLFYQDFFIFIQLMYNIIFIAILLGLMLLTSSCLNHNKMNSKIINLYSFIQTIKLVFIELWHIFIYNIHKSYRFTQLLLLIGLPLLIFYSATVSSIFIEIAKWIFFIAYFAIVLYNAIRFSFSITLFYNKNLTPSQAIQMSWGLTHKKFFKIVVGYGFALASILVFFIVISVFLGAIANLLLLNYLTIALSYKISTMIAFTFALAPAIVGYYFGFMEIYSQLIKEYESHVRVKRVLVNRVLNSNKKPKEIVKKKVVKKKATKKFKKKNSKKKLKK